MSGRAQPDWRQQVAARFRSHCLLKNFGIAAYITVFLCAYFALLNHPQFPVTIVPLQPLDHLVGFEPWALAPYATLWFYIGIVPSLLYLRGEMAPYLSAVTMLCVIGCAIFLFCPTAVPTANIDWAQYPAVALLKSTDAAGNACPSLHVAFSVLTALWLGWLLRRIGAPTWLHVANAGWCVLIAWSTLATKQHVALDLETGALLGGTIALLHLRLWPSLRATHHLAPAEPHVFDG